MAAYDKSNRKEDPHDYKGRAAPVSYAASSSSSAAAAASGPWRESVIKRRSTANGKGDNEPVQKKVKLNIALEESAVPVSAAAASALGIKGIRQTIIKQSLLSRGGECVLVTGDGQRCDRATQYIRDKGVEGKERSIDCLPYCRDQCENWARGLLENPPTAAVAFVDGIAIGRFPLDSSSIAIINNSDKDELRYGRSGWFNPQNSKFYTNEAAISWFCAKLKAGSVIPVTEMRLSSFVPFRRRLGTPSMSTVAEWKQIGASGRLTWKFEGTLHPQDGVWIGPMKRWSFFANPQSGLNLITSFPFHEGTEIAIKDLQKAT